MGKLFYRPRWLLYLRFSHRVNQWLQANPQTGWIIHSHERVGVHDVTTFHGPPFASVRSKLWWKKISIRIAAQLWLERRELRVPKFIVPNSEIIARQLANHYPEYAHKLTHPVVPGVLSNVEREPRQIPQDGGVIGFVGKEWKRKGLPLAVEIVAQLRQQRPNLQLWIIGPVATEIEHLFANWQGGYQLLGWRGDAEHFRSIDVLLHPAKAEPYGMVISEAMAARVPVVVSDQCGAAAQVEPQAGNIIKLTAPVADWEAAVLQQLNRIDEVPRFVRGWDVVAHECETIYESIPTQGIV